MTKFKRCLSAFLAFAMVFGMFSGMGNVFAPEAEAATLGGATIPTYASLNETYDNFVYVGVEVYEVATGTLTDGKVKAGQWLEYREYIKSDMWVGNIDTAYLYDKRFFDVRVVSSTTASTSETFVKADYEAGVKVTTLVNTAHPMTEARVPTLALTACPCTDISAYTNGHCLIDEATYTNLDQVRQTITFDGTVSADALDMRSDEWFVNWYVKVLDAPTITESTSYSPDGVWKNTPHPTNTTMGNPSCIANIPTGAIITGEETDIVDRTKCTAMNMPAKFSTLTLLNDDTYTNFEIEKEVAPVEGTSNIKSYDDLNAEYDNFVYVGVDVYELEVDATTGEITQNYGLTDGYVKAGQWLEYREYIKSDMWVGNIDTAYLYDKRFFDVRVVSNTTASTSTTFVKADYEAGVKVTTLVNTAHPMTEARVPTLALTACPCTDISAYTNGHCLIDEATYTNLDQVRQTITFDGTVSADALDMRSNEWFVNWYVKVLDAPTITESTSYSPDGVWKNTPHPTNTTMGNPSCIANIPTGAIITGEETDIVDRTKCTAMNMPAKFSTLTLLNDDTYTTLKIGDPPAAGSEYTATFVVDGETVSEATYAEGDTITVPEDPTKDGYSFKGWSTDGSTIVTEFVMGTADVTYTAIFEEVVKYTATFVVDGETVNEAEYAEGETIIAPDDPSKTGYNFAGWSPAVGTMGAADATFTAQWTAKTYTVTFYKNKGDATSHATLTVDYNAAYSTPSDPSQSGYTFVKWVDADGNAMAATHTVDSDVVFYAEWSAASFDAIFDANGGAFADASTSKTVSTAYGAEIVAPTEEPTRTGYTFGGWEGFTAGTTMGAANVTYKAIWTANSIGVHFMDGEKELELKSGDYGSQITAIGDPTKEGYTFKGWAYEDGTTASFPLTLGAEDIYVYAVWEGNDITLNFYGETESDWYAYTILKAGAELVVPADAAAPTKTGYKFVGYFDAEGNAMPETVPSKDTNYFAKFEAETYTATFVDGETTVGTYEGIYNSTIVLPEEPTKEGHTFAGWEGYTDGMKMPASDKTFTATWTVNTYKVFYYVDNNLVHTEEVKYGETIPAYTYEPEDAGISFAGWGDADPAGTTMGAENISVYASTGKNTFNVTFTINGENPQVVPFEYGAAVVAPEYTVPEGYTFSGWDVPATMPAEDITIDATLTANTYTAYFWLDDAMTQKYTEVKTVYGEAIEVPTPPQVDGQNFIEWDPTPATMGAGDMNFVAVFEPIEYFVTFYNEDGSVVDGYEYIQYWGDEITEDDAPEMSKTGYDFAGWYYEDGSKATFPITVNSDIDLTAKFTVQGHKVYYYVDGAEYDYDAYVFGDAVTLRAPLVKEGYTFSGWKDADGNDAVLPETMPEYDITVYGTWTINTYDAIFVGEDGWTETVPTNYNAVPVAPTAPEKAGYSFIGWQAADGTVYAADSLPAMGAANATYTAVYSAGAVNYTIETYTMGVDGTYGEPETEVKAGETDSTVTLNPVAAEGFTLDTETSVLSDVVAADGSTTLKIYYIRNQYTFKTVVDGVETPVTYYYGATLADVADPVKEGYSFVSWDATIPETMPANNVTVTAQFQINQYTITFDTAGGSAIGAIKADYGTAVIEPADPTKEGYTFAGWDKDIPDTIPAENVTITAQWTINQYTITFVDTGDVAYEPIKQDYNTAIADVADPVKTGYTFTGWDVAVPETMPATDMTITATWEINYYDATFIIDGKSEVVKTAYGEVPVAPPAVKVGYTFEGWDKELVAIGVDGATYTAQFSANTYDAIFDANGGAWADSATTQTVPTVFDTAIVAPTEEPTREGYIFAGWEPEVGNMVTEGITFLAQWTQDLNYCRVQNVERITQGVYEEQRAVYKVTVQGSPVKLQFVHNVENGTTWTYDRGTGEADYEGYVPGDLTESGLVGVTAYNAADEVVDFGSADTAYEVWTIITILTEGEYKVRAKLSYTSDSWESIDFAYDYDMVFDEKTVDAETMVISVTPEANTVKRGNKLKVTFITSDSVDRLRIVKENDDGTSTISSYSENATAVEAITDNGDGTLTWVINIRFTYSGTATEQDQNWTVWYRAVGESAWTKTEKTIDVKVTKYAVTTSPSTSYDAYTLISVQGPATAVSGELTDVVIKTTSDVTRVRLNNMDGRTATYLATSNNVTAVDNGDGTTTWTIKYRFSTAGDQTWAVQVRGTAWSATTADGCQFTVTVTE